MKAVDWKRHDHKIYDKTTEWFDIMGKELRAPTILQENVCNMDETGTLLSAPKSLRVLVGKDDLRNYRGAGVQRTLVSAFRRMVGASIRSSSGPLPPIEIHGQPTQRQGGTSRVARVGTPILPSTCTGFSTSLIRRHVPVPTASHAS